jgi:tripartite-type tricarboxylate transporter receptor subunit TctC
MSNPQAHAATVSLRNRHSRRSRSPLSWAPIALLVAHAAGLLPADAAAQTYPTRAVKMIIPFGSGAGGADRPGRLLADGLTRIWGQPVVVENRPGAGGNIGADIVAKANPDGYTLLFTNFAPLTINLSLYKDMPFNARTDFAPVTLAFISPLVLTVANSVPANSVAELVSYLKARPGAFNYSAGNAGTATHLAAELFKQRAGIDVVPVLHRTGADMTTSMIRGDSAFAFNGMFVLPMVQAGQKKALAISSSQRSPVAPALPTVAESGFPGFDVSSWGGLLAPAKTPSAIVARIYADAVRALTDPDTMSKMASVGGELKTSSSSAEFARQISSEIDLWAKVIKAANISLQ